MIDEKMVRAELQNIQKYFEAKMDMTIGYGKLKMACWARTCHDALELLKPVKRGRWIDMGDATVVCSECNSQIIGEPDYDFCPSCGADMREGEKDG